VIDVDAPLDEVWAVMMDTAQYPAWNPFVARIDAPPGPLVVGTPLRLHVRWADGGQVVSPEEVEGISPPHDEDSVRRAVLAYRYTGVPARFGLLRCTRVQTLEQRPGGATTYRSTEHFHGLLARAVPLAKVQDGFARHARALKGRVERR
jgi:hypothetical protein